MKSIRYLVAIDDQARFRSDVQLDLFDDHQENLALLSSYLFTVAIPSAAKISAATSVSSVDLLNQLLEAFTNNRTENRIVTIANYGHGKSHLALALANYFSKPADSEEFKLVHEKLEHAINDQARSSRFYDFKQARGEFLVVRLRGDTPSSLREQFIPSLEKALRDHTATANVQPPLWHKYAESLLTNLSEDEVCRANERLASLHLDVPTLIAQVQQRKDVRDHCIEALTAAKNMAPNLGAQLSLRETVEWVADNLCGEGKPLAGVLVMFDEFSLYVSRYAQRGAVGELQDLLNGVSTRPAKVVFLAFAQHDPLTVADNAPLSDHGRDTLKHELTRIPKKLVLYTLLESVIDAYLRQREMAWLNFTEDRDVALALDCASHIAYEAFTERYTKGLQWVPAEFDKIVTKGCFPLHPLTTALLCNLKFSTSSSMSDPRTVLGFVMQHIADKIDQMPVINNVVNWVRPIALVDYFGENISPEFYRIYQSVKRNFGYDTGDDQRSTLTALFLQEAGQITLSPDAQLEFMAESTGLSISGVTRALSALSDKNMIRYDSIKKTYSFWPANTDSAGFEWLVRSKLEKIPFNLAALEKLNGRLSSEYGYTTIPMNVTWGHPEDWAANQLILTREYIECDYLRSFTKPFAASAQGLEDGNRGGVLWLLARNEEDVRWYRENIETLIDKALSGNSTPPLIVILPKEPAFDLVEAFRRNLALQAFLQNDRSTGGTALYDHEVQQADITLKAELKRFMGDKDTYLEAIREPSRVTAPSSFRAAILELQSLTIRNILTRAYELAYRTTPREFFTQYRVATSASNKLRDAVKLVAGVLFTGQTGGLAASVRVNPVASDLVNKYLMQKWGSLSSNHVLQVPTDRRMQQAWNSLDHSFTPGSKEKSVVEPLIELLNPPHGYDFNTVTLLFAAWFGYHNHDIALKDRGLAAKHTLFAEFLQKGPRDFLQNCKIRNISLVRRNPDDARLLVRAIIDRTAEQSFAQDEAEQALVKLESFSKDTRNNQRDREDAQIKITALQRALADVKQYRTQVNQIERTVDTEQNYRSLLNALNGLQQLPRLTLVKTSALEPVALQQSILSRLEDVVNAHCKVLEKPQRSTQVELNERQLTQMRDAIREAGISQLEARLQNALDTLKQTAQELEKRQSEEGFRAELEEIDLSGSLNYLKDKAKRLQQMGDVTHEVLVLRDQKLKYLTYTITELEGQVQQLPTQIETVANSAAADSLRDLLLKSSSRYQDSLYQETVQVALNRLSQLREFFQEVNRLQRSSLQQASDVETLLKQCNTMRIQYNDVLAITQIAILDQTEQSIHTQLQTKQKDALAWLQSCSDELRKGSDINHIAEKLSNPPAFFPKENVCDLDRLRMEVQEQIDKNAILKVEQAFRAIADRKKQEECLQRLTQIMNEQPASSWAFWRRKA